MTNINVIKQIAKSGCMHNIWHIETTIIALELNYKCHDDSYVVVRIK